MDPRTTQRLAALAPPDRSGRIALGITMALLIAVCGSFSVLCAGLEVGLNLVMQPGTALLALFFAGFFGFPYLLIILWLDRNEKEPWYLVLSALLWGAVIATSLSGVFNTLFGAVAMVVVGDANTAHQLMASFSAPFIEELTKGLALVALYVFFRKDFDNVLDGVVYGALVGLGFAVFENFSYYVNKTDGVGSMVLLTWIRGVVSATGGSHATFTALTGLGLGLFRVLRRGALRWALPIVGLGASMFLHFAWNTFTGLILGFVPGGSVGDLLVGLPLAVVIIQVPFLVFVLVTAFLALRHEHKLIVTYLQGESPPVVHPEELERLVPARRRAWHSTRLLLRFQLKTWWRTRHRNVLLIRLAFEKWHMDAEVDGEVEDARAHAVRVRELRQALKEYAVV